MTPGQNRVIGLLAVLLVLEAIKQPAVKQQWDNVKATITGNISAASNTSANAPQWTIPNVKQMLYWGFGATALVLLAAPAPDAATWLAVILLVLILLSDVQLYMGYIKPPASQPSTQKA